MDPATVEAAGSAVAQTADAAAAAASQLAASPVAATGSAFDAENLLRLLQQGGLTVYPLAICSVIAVAIVIERLWKFHGLEARTRELTRRVVDLLAKRDLAGARALCDAANSPVGAIFAEGLRWQEIALEDLERVLATSRQEATLELRRGLWVLGTIGSLAPFVGLFGTVVGIIRSFHEMAVHGSGGFAIVAAGISEALVATAAGLLVAIVALLFFNYLQVQVTSLSATFARACERFVHALLFVAAASEPEPPARPGREVSHGSPITA